MSSIRSTKAQRDAEFAAFYEPAATSLMRTAWLLTGDADAARELVQAAMVKTYAAWPRVRPGEGLAYARRVLVNHRTDVWRATRREVSVDTTAHGHAGSWRGPLPTDVVDDRDIIVRLLGGLTGRQRAVVVLRYYHDLSEQSVAELLGISVGTAKSTASKALAALRLSSVGALEGDVR